MSHPCLSVAASLANVLRTALGPCGRDKLVVSSTGEVIVTADGCTVISQMGAEETPVGRLLSSLAKAQEDAVGDGTTSVVVIVGALCDAAAALIDQGAHPWTVIQGFQKAANFACQHLQNLKWDPASPATLDAGEALRMSSELHLQAVAVALGEHVPQEDRVEWATACMQAVQLISGVRNVVHHSSVHLLAIQSHPDVHGSGLETVQVLHGVVLRKAWAQDSFVPQSTPAQCRTAVFSCALEPPKLKTQCTVQVHSREDYGELGSLEDAFCAQAVEVLRACNVQLVLCQWGLSPLLCHALATHQIAVVTWIPGRALEQAALAVGAVISPRIEDLQEHMCGCAVRCWAMPVALAEEPALVLEGEAGAVATMLVQPGAQALSEASLQALKDGVAAAATLLRHPELVTGGGSAEAAVHSALQSHIHTESQGLESRVMEAWADAVLSIVVTLAENAGVNAAAAQAELLAHHRKGCVHHGVSVEGDICSMVELSVFESLQVKEMILRQATEMATTLVKIDGNVVPISHDS